MRGVDGMAIAVHVIRGGGRPLIGLSLVSIWIWGVSFSLVGGFVVEALYI